MKIENTVVFGFSPALRAMRNPHDSWDKSDTNFTGGFNHFNPSVVGGRFDICAPELPQIGPNDLKLALSLINAGREHRKFLRQIMIWVDLTLPRYVWTEWDTYKVATVRNSCGTMHRLGKNPLTLDDFQGGYSNADYLAPIIEILNYLSRKLKDEKIFAYRLAMKQLLPESFLQKATCTINYETALTMLFQRHNHRLHEWQLNRIGSICDWIIHLPYMREFSHAIDFGEQLT